MQLTTLDTLYEKMGEYTKMEDELAFDEFVSYFNDVMAFLQKEYQNLSQDDLVKARGITMIVASNAQMRSLRKDANRKKFAKMCEKASFWENAISLNLRKSGMTQDELDEKLSKMWE